MAEACGSFFGLTFHRSMQARAVGASDANDVDAVGTAAVCAGKLNPGILPHLAHNAHSGLDVLFRVNLGRAERAVPQDDLCRFEAEVLT